MPVISLTVALALTGISRAEEAPQLPRVGPAMRSADFWTGRLHKPGSVILSPAAIERFNARNMRRGLINDLVRLSENYPLAYVNEEIRSLARDAREKSLYRADGVKVTPADLAPIEANMALKDAGRTVGVRYAVTTTFADVRLMPTGQAFYEKPGDTDFDQLQNSGIDPAVPLAVLAESADGQWLFIKDAISSGWIKSSQAAFLPREEWRHLLRPAESAVVTAAQADIFADAAMTQPLSRSRMGTHYAIRGSVPGGVEIVYPQRDARGQAKLGGAYLRGADVSIGDLPYTPRTVISQAFKLLDAPYGWGDVGQRQDCSRLLNMVFATAGIILPRNSSDQGRAGVPLADFRPDVRAEQKEALITSRGIPGATLLRLKGHIMLYVGKVDGRPYVVHATSGYRLKAEQGESLVPLMKVVLSDLSLGEGSSKGSLLERVVSVRLIAAPGP